MGRCGYVTKLGAFPCFFVVVALNAKPGWLLLFNVATPLPAIMNVPRVSQTEGHFPPQTGTRSVTGNPIGPAPPLVIVVPSPIGNANFRGK